MACGALATCPKCGGIVLVGPSAEDLARMGRTHTCKVKKGK